MARLLGPLTRNNPVTAPLVVTNHSMPAGEAVELSPMSVIDGADAKLERNKAKRAKNAPEKKGPRDKQKWFDENFSGKPEDVLQVQLFSARGKNADGTPQGFICEPCGIPGKNAILIRGKDGRGYPIKFYKVDPETKVKSVLCTVNGFLVGATCLKNYGHIPDVYAAMSANYSNQQKQQEFVKLEAKPEILQSQDVVQNVVQDVTEPEVSESV